MSHPRSQKDAFLRSDSGKPLQRMGDSSLSPAERSEAEKLWRASLGQTTDYSVEVSVSENLTEIPQDGVWQLAELLGYDIGPDGDFVQSRPVWEKHYCSGCSRTVWTLQADDEVHSFVSQRGHAEGELLIDYDGEEPEKAMDSAVKLLEEKNG